ncbi:glycosyltransferase [Sphingopyxis sp. PET50]|uniref:glycosyltransferase n=1 Tax=Sphingopyxis sp. PET50 TaxID=2976533 RepID=UPI0021AF95CA|nr:glycosyltransferase [Sphingopyxis sp. PET50]
MGLTATQVPLGFDPRLFQPLPAVREAVRAELGLTRPTIAYFGRQTPEKGIHLLIDALDRIRDGNWQFLIDDFIGASAYTAQLQAQIERLGLRERVIFFESKHEDMARYMNAADIIVLPSISTPKWKEQYGRVIQEVMACGRTMVGSRSGAIPEVMGGQGHLFDEGDVGALAKLLATLLEKGDFADEAARAYALANLSVNRQAEIMAGLLRREG